MKRYNTKPRKVPHANRPAFPLATVVSFVPACRRGLVVGGDCRARPKVVPSANAALPATVRDRPARRSDVPRQSVGSKGLSECVASFENFIDLYVDRTSDES